MAEQEHAIDLTSRASYAHWTPVNLRWCDTDALGHINNVAISSFIEAGRVAVYYDVMHSVGVDTSKLDIVLARVEIDFIEELHYPGVVDVGSRFLQMGNKSLKTGYGVFAGDTCVATSVCVNVFFDIATRRSVAPPPHLREALKLEVER